MTGFEVKRRDGPARISLLTTPDGPLRLPAVADTLRLFPDLGCREFSNVPLAAPEEFARRYHIRGSGQPVAIHPALVPDASSGDCVLVPGWHTALANPRDYVDWLVRLKESLPPDTAWYAPGAALPSNVHILCYSGFDLFDYTAVDLKAAQGLFCLPEGEFPREDIEEDICRCPGCRESDLRLHNRLALDRELALVRQFIGMQQIREFIDGRARSVAAHVAILRRLDSRIRFMEERTAVARSVRLGAMSGDALSRPEVRRFAARVLDRYIPPAGSVAVLLPCSARKPYSVSQSHRRFAGAITGRAVELIVTSPLGLVPREIERIYPAAHYDIPVTGHWDREELAFTAGILAEFLSRHPFRRVIAHLEGGALEAARMAAAICGTELEVTGEDRPVSDASLARLSDTLDGEQAVRHDVVRGTLSWQFCADVDTRGMTVRWKPPNLSVRKGRDPLFSIDPGTGFLRPTFEGWNFLPGRYRVVIDDFPVKGDILAPGVVSADPLIREGDEVLVEGPQARATGRAAMPAFEMEASQRGVAVRVRKVLKQ
ncbi:MAG: pseudouridine synthase [Methanomicrobiales archaeon]|nr:pseudouridine synthase [Methanomicrobiales archaeon]